jgi:hypothetical protein
MQYFSPFKGNTADRLFLEPIGQQALPIGFLSFGQPLRLDPSRPP